MHSSVSWYSKTLKDFEEDNGCLFQFLPFEKTSTLREIARNYSTDLDRVCEDAIRRGDIRRDIYDLKDTIESISDVYKPNAQTNRLLRLRRVRKPSNDATEITLNGEIQESVDCTQLQKLLKWRMKMLICCQCIIFSGLIIMMMYTISCSCRDFYFMIFVICLFICTTFWSDWTILSSMKMNINASLEDSSKWSICMPSLLTYNLEILLWFVLVLFWFALVFAYGKTRAKPKQNQSNV